MPLLRTVLRPFAIHAAYSPIETIVFFSIVGTLAYFYILSAIKHSFLGFSQNVTVGPSYAMQTAGDWVSVSERVWRDKVAEKAEVFLWEGADVSATLESEAFKSTVLAVGENAVAVKEGLKEAFLSALQESGVALSHESDPSNESWVTYAAKAVGSRFWGVMKRTPSLDITLILLGYGLMHLSFILLFWRSRKLGSTVALPAAIISSSVLAVFLAVPIAMALDIPFDVVKLSEALPFLVCTVGFDKPMRLAQAVFNSRYIVDKVDKNDERHKEFIGSPLPSSEVILGALEETYRPIIRDYGLEIAVLVVGASSGISGLKEVCAIAALILGMDCMMMTTFLSAVLAVMVEVRRIKTIRDNVNTPAQSPKMKSSLKLSASTDSMREEYASPTSQTVWQRVFGDRETSEGEVTRLKLLLIVTFVSLHFLNLIAPLTSSSSPSATVLASKAGSHLQRKVDIYAPQIQAALADLFTSDPAASLVRVHPGLKLSAAGLGAAASPMTFSVTLPTLPSLSGLVSDPFMSKSLFLILAVSITLNGYLLKGIAIGAGASVGATPNGKVAAAGVRFGIDEKEEVTAVAVPVKSSKALNMADVDKKLQAVASAPIIKDQPVPLQPKKFVIPAETPSPQELEFSTLEAVDHLSMQPIRPISTLLQIYSSGPRPLPLSLLLLTDEEVIALCQHGTIPAYSLEKVLGGSPGVATWAKGIARAVRVRRALISRASATNTLESSLIPHLDYDYTKVMGACCENVVGFVPLPLGIAGPLKVDGKLLPIPMATAEGTLVASTSRGAKALNAGGGVTTVLTADGMTRGPAIDFPSIVEAAHCRAWAEDTTPGGGYHQLKEAFEKTSRFAKLSTIKVAMAGRTLYVRFATKTGDAMGMNMISKGTEAALACMQLQYPTMIVLALSGNYCTDKKPAAINWIEGRGKSIVAEAVIPGKIVESVLKTTVKGLVEVNIKKNLIGSAMAGSVGGFNAHAANILTAIFLATGQDPAQNVESSNCITLMEATNNGQDLLMTVSMPSIEVGTVGGGTVLSPQGAVLEMLGLKGANASEPGRNAQGLARLIASSVMAGELSLMSALAAGHLVRAHMVHNRTPQPSAPQTPGTMTPAINPLGHVGAEREAKKTEKSLEKVSSTASLPPYSKD